MKQKIFYLGKEERSRLFQHLKEILQGKSEITFAYLFGSFAEGLPFHDIDVGIYLSRVKEEASILYSLELTHILSKDIQFPVDVRVINFASIPFLYHVIQGVLILERDEEIRLNLMEDTMRRYLDLKPKLRKGLKEAFGR